MHTQHTGLFDNVMLCQWVETVPVVTESVSQGMEGVEGGDRNSSYKQS